MWDADKIAYLREALKRGGKSTRQLARELHEDADEVYDFAIKIYKGETIDMGYENRGKVDVEEFWRMVDGGLSSKAIAARYGISVNAVNVRIRKGRPKGLGQTAEALSEAEEAKFEEILDSVDAGKPTPTETPTERPIDVSLGSVDAAKPTPTVPLTETRFETEETDMIKDTKDSFETASDDLTKLGNAYELTAGKPYEPDEIEVAPAPDIIDLAYAAKHMAMDAKFAPTFLSISTERVHTTIRVSGKDSHGRICEIEYSVTDPTALNVPV